MLRDNSITIVSIFVTIAMFSLVSVSSISFLLLPNIDNNVNAQIEYDDNENYYKDDRDYYKDDSYYYDKYNDDYYYPAKDNEQAREPPTLLVDKEVLFCDMITKRSGNACIEPESILFSGPESGRYVQECSSEKCEGINPSMFDIKITEDIEFQGSEEDTKLNYGERFTVIQKVKLESSSEDIDRICQLSGFDNGFVDSFDNGEREFISCILFEGDCNGFVQDELNRCTVKNFIIAVEENKDIVVVWEEDLPESNDKTFATMSMDGGSTFDTGFNVSNTLTDSFSPQVAMSNDNVVVVSKKQISGVSEIFATMSMDGGSTFDTGFNVSNTLTDSFSPQVAMSGDNVVVVWVENLPVSNQVFATMSMDGGSTFDTGFNVSNTLTDSFSPQVAMSGDNVVVVWVEQLSGNTEAFAAVSNDGGATFGPSFNVSDTTKNSFDPQVAISGDNVVVVWEEKLSGNNDEIFASVSIDGGATFGPNFDVSDTTTDSFDPQVAMSGDNVIVVWEEELSGNNTEAFAAVSNDGGATFGPSFNVSDTTTNSFDPQLVMSGNNVFVVWEERLLGNNGEAFAAVSNDGGATFGPIFNVSDTTTNSFDPQLVIN
ncbi:MAG: sialidase family protein [Nitrososphaeraceae archaeon]